MTWLVRLTPTDPSLEPIVTVIPSNEVRDFLDSHHFSWNAADKLLRVGTIRKIEVDYLATP